MSTPNPGDVLPLWNPDIPGEEIQAGRLGIRVRPGTPAAAKVLAMEAAGGAELLRQVLEEQRIIDGLSTEAANDSAQLVDLRLDLLFLFRGRTVRFGPRPKACPWKNLPGPALLWGWRLDGLRQPWYRNQDCKGSTSDNWIIHGIHFCITITQVKGLLCKKF